ncbi:MAG: spondin domain-containing protein [Acidobacteriota bacterium]
MTRDAHVPRPSSAAILPAPAAKFRGELAFLLGAAAIAAILAPRTLAQQATETAQYSVRFDAAWSASTHPIGFPGDRAHFSSLIGGVHGDGVSFWQVGNPASDGIELMAEIGRTSPLDQEVQAAIDAGTASQIVRGGGIARSPGRSSASFAVSQTFPRITLVTMIAPSPDWFVGVSGYSLFENGDWVQQRAVPLFAYDAGTDSGQTFTSGNSDTRPAGPIRRITDGSLGNGVPIGTLTFTRQDTPPGPALALQNGRFEVTVTYQDFELTRGDGQPGGFSEDTGYFWFFDQSNIEVLVKIINACEGFDRYWVFASGLTNVEVNIRVTDTLTGQVNEYSNPLGRAFPPIQDTEAFTVCP